MARIFFLDLDGIKSVNGARVSCNANEGVAITGDNVRSLENPNYKSSEFTSSPSSGNAPTMG